MRSWVKGFLIKILRANLPSLGLALVCVPFTTYGQHRISVLGHQPVLHVNSSGMIHVTTGELAAERERNKAAAQPDTAKAHSPHKGSYHSPQKGHIALCLSPSAAKAKHKPVTAAISVAAAARTAAGSSGSTATVQPVGKSAS